MGSVDCGGSWLRIWVAGAAGDGDKAGVDKALARTQVSVIGGVAEMDAAGGNEN